MPGGGEKSTAISSMDLVGTDLGKADSVEGVQKDVANCALGKYGVMSDFFMNHYHNSAVMCATVDYKTGKISMCNDTFARELKYSSHTQLEGKYMGDMFRKNGDFEEIWKAAKKVLDSATDKEEGTSDGKLQEGVMTELLPVCDKTHATLMCAGNNGHLEALVIVKARKGGQTREGEVDCEIFPKQLLESRSNEEHYELNDGMNTKVNLSLPPEADNPCEIYGILSSHVSDGIWDWNMKTNYEYLSPRFKEILGYANDEMENSPSAWQSILHPDDAKVCGESIKAHLERQEPFQEVLRFTHKQGHQVAVVCRGVAIKNEQGEFVRMVGTHTDITHVRNCELRLKESIAKVKAEQERAEEASKMKSVFLANMSHEIRTPLNSINGLTELLLRSKSLPLEEKALVKIIATSGEALITLINDILDFSKIEAGKMTFQFTEANVKEFFESTITMFQIAASEKDVILNVTLHESLPSVIITDFNRLRQILINLIGNALKFTSTGSVNVRASCEKRTFEPGESWGDKTSKSHMLFCEVEDSGTGIPSSALEKLCEPFTQAHVEGRAGLGGLSKGTGLGLSICKSLVQLLGGKFEITSEEGIGCTVKFQIPVEVEETGISLDRTVSKEVTDIDRMGVVYPLKILVADDNAYNRKVIQLMLKKMQYDCDLSENGLEAVDAYKAKKYDVILMDVQMPVMNGLEASENIFKEYGRLEDRPLIVCLTAMATAEDLQKSVDIGMQEFVTKPISFSKLSKALFSFIRGKFKCRVPSFPTPSQCSNANNPTAESILEEEEEE
eukprot:Nk52_evm28s358 gene=Nk52_evmTU28s358